MAALTDTTKIIENGIVATGDSGNRIGRLALLIRNDRIVEVSPHAEPLKNLYPAAEVIDAGGKMVLPGFVDAHIHGESVLLRSLTATTPMNRWEKDRRLKTAVDYLNGSASREELEIVYRLAYFYALKSGVTCLSDFGLDNLEFSPTTSFEVMKKAELKGFIGLHNRDQTDKCRSLHSPLIHFAETISGEDDLTTYTIQSALRSADDLKLPITVHLGETRRGLETIKKNFHRTVVELLKEYHLYNLRIQLVHFSALEENDADVLAEAKLPVVVTPASAVLKDVDLPPLGDLLSRGVVIALGTDWSIPDPFQNVRSFVTIARAQNRPVPGPFELLALVTRNPARALGLQDELGTIEPGKKADLVFVDIAESRRAYALDAVHPAVLLSTVLLESSTKHVSDVMVNGNFYVRAGNLLTYSEEDLTLDARRLLTKLVALSPRKENTAPPEPADRPAPVLNLETGTDDDNRESWEEGFRVLTKGQGTPEPQKKVIPLHPEQNTSSQPPKPVKKVFGEDDI